MQSWVSLLDGDAVSVIVFADCTLLLDCTVTIVTALTVALVIDDTVISLINNDDVIDDDIIDDNIALGLDILVISTVLMFIGKLVDCGMESNSLVANIDAVDDMIITLELAAASLEDNILDAVNPSSDVKIMPVDMSKLTEDVCNKSVVVDSTIIISDDSTKGVGETTSEQSVTLSIDNNSSLRFDVTLNIN